MSTTDTKKVIFQTPIPFGKNPLKELILRRPMAGELRGTKLSRIAELDVDELFKIIPRISSPVVSEAQLNQLDSCDLMILAGEFAGFFSPKEPMEKVTQPE